MSKGNGILRPKGVRGVNSAVILQLLRQYGPLSRADLARHSSLSEGSVSRITSELLQRQILCEDGAESSTGGRPATRLRLHDLHLGVGVELGRGEARIASATLSGKILDTITVPISSNPKEALSTVAMAIQQFSDQYRDKHIEGIGVSAHGIVNSRSGVIEFGNLPGWVGIAVQEWLQSAVKIPVHVDNNVRLAAIAEYSYGNLPEVRSSHCLLFVKVDDGIGIGIVLDGKLYYGPHDASGEFGQMVIADSGDPAAPEGTGSFEQLASSDALCEYYNKLTGARSFLRAGEHRTRVRKICQLAVSGDTLALKALSRICRYLGIGLTNVIWGLNADAVVLDAPINDAWPLVVRMIRDQFPKGEEIVSFRHLALRPSSLGGEAAIIGAATLPFKTLFTSGETNRSGHKKSRGMAAKGKQ